MLLMFTRNLWKTAEESDVLWRVNQRFYVCDRASASAMLDHVYGTARCRPASSCCMVPSSTHPLHHTRQQYDELIDSSQRDLEP